MMVRRNSSNVRQPDEPTSTTVVTPARNPTWSGTTLLMPPVTPVPRRPTKT